VTQVLLALIEVLQPLTIKTNPLQKVKLFAQLFRSKCNPEAEYSDETFESAAPIKCRDRGFYAIFKTVFAPRSYISDLYQY
jgi:hypothetical protein